MWVGFLMDRVSSKRCDTTVGLFFSCSNNLLERNHVCLRSDEQCCCKPERLSAQLRSKLEGRRGAAPLNRVRRHGRVSSGEPEQFERLRAAIRALHARKIKSAELERRVEKEAKSLGIGFMSRTDIDKFRTGAVDRPRDIQKVVPLWNVVFSDPFLLRDPPPSPVAAEDSINPEHEFFYSAVKFFDVHQHRNTRPKVDLIGQFVFYHFSEYFHKFSEKLPRAVVVGQWDIALADGVCCVKKNRIMMEARQAEPCGIYIQAMDCRRVRICA